MFAIEVSFVDRPHIDEAENNQSSNEKVGVQFFAGEEECKESADGDNEYRSPCIAAEDAHAYVFQCSDDSGHLIVLGCLRQEILTFLFAQKVEEESRDYCKKQSDATGEAERYVESFSFLF